MPEPLSPSPVRPVTRALTPIGWPLTVVLAALVAVAPLATDMYLPGFPAIAADLQATPSGVQLTLTTFLVGLAFGQLVFGPLSDRWGRFWPLLTSAVLCAVAGAVCALAPTVTVLSGARLVQGFAGAGGMVIGRAIVADLVQGRAAAKSYTMMFTVGGVAPVLAPIVGALLLRPIHWRGILWVMAGLCAAMAVLVAVIVKETHPPQVRQAHASTLARDVRRVLTTPGFRGPVVIVVACFGLMMAYIAASPFLYQKVIGLTEVEYGIAFGINATAIIGVGFLAGRLLDRVSSRTMIRGPPPRSSVRPSSCSGWHWPECAASVWPCRSSSPWVPSARSWAMPRPWPCPRSARWRARGAPSSASASSSAARSPPRWWGSAESTRPWCRPW